MIYTIQTISPEALSLNWADLNTKGQPPPLLDYSQT